MSHRSARRRRHAPLLACIILAGSSGLAASLAPAQSAPDPKEPDKGASEALRFWVGEWDVYDINGGALLGTDTVTMRQGEKIIHESWQGADDGYTGESVSYFDLADNTWKQVWVDHDGRSSVLEASTRRLDDGLKFRGKISVITGDVHLLRTLMKPMDNGWVRRVDWISGDKGRNWQLLYDQVLVPRGAEIDPDDDFDGLEEIRRF